MVPCHDRQPDNMRQPHLKEDVVPESIALERFFTLAPYAVRNAAIAAIDMTGLSAAMNGKELANWHGDMPTAAVRSRQLSFLAGRLCAERVLRLSYGQPAELGRNEKGLPQWPDGFTGAITHHDRLALAIAGPGEYGLGIDSELVAAPAACRAIIDVCCTASDRDFVQGGKTAQRATLLFSAKEAAYKAISPLLGRIADFTEFEVSRYDPDGRTLVLAPVRAGDWQCPIPLLKVNYLLHANIVHCWVDVRPFKRHANGA